MTKIFIGSAKIEKDISTKMFYMHNDGWICYRPKEEKIAKGLAYSMRNACYNSNIVYSVSNPSSLSTYVKNGIKIKDISVKTGTNHLEIIKACCYENGIDISDVNTVRKLKSKLKTSGYFEKKFTVKPIDIGEDGSEQLYNGDILISKNKDTIAIVTSGRPRNIK